MIQIAPENTCVLSQPNPPAQATVTPSLLPYLRVLPHLSVCPDHGLLGGHRAALLSTPDVTQKYQHSHERQSLQREGAHPEVLCCCCSCHSRLDDHHGSRTSPAKHLALSSESRRPTPGRPQVSVRRSVRLPTSLSSHALSLTCVALGSAPVLVPAADGGAGPDVARAGTVASGGTSAGLASLLLAGTWPACLAAGAAPPPGTAVTALRFCCCAGEGAGGCLAALAFDCLGFLGALGLTA